MADCSVEVCSTRRQGAKPSLLACFDFALHSIHDNFAPRECALYLIANNFAPLKYGLVCCSSLSGTSSEIASPLADCA